MGFAQTLAQESKPRRGPACSVGRLLETLAPKDAKQVTAAIADSNVMLAAISRAIKSEFGVSIGSGTIGRHRKHECSCGDRRGVR